MNAWVTWNARRAGLGVVTDASRLERRAIRKQGSRCRCCGWCSMLAVAVQLPDPRDDYQLRPGYEMLGSVVRDRPKLRVRAIDRDWR
jgi:hypothetical protein